MDIYFVPRGTSLSCLFLLSRESLSGLSLPGDGGLLVEQSGAAVVSRCVVTDSPLPARERAEERGLVLTRGHTSEMPVPHVPVGLLELCLDQLFLYHFPAGEQWPQAQGQ